MAAPIPDTSRQNNEDPCLTAGWQARYYSVRIDQAGTQMSAGRATRGRLGQCGERCDLICPDLSKVLRIAGGGCHLAPTRNRLNCTLTEWPARPHHSIAVDF
jgi:hypothetical protein